MRQITILGLDHRLQWKDTGGGHLDSLLRSMLESDPSVELMAEEANGLPTTVAQRLAFTFHKPWKNVDMNAIEQHQARITDERLERGGGPLMDDEDGYTQCYLPDVDGRREQHWLSVINGYRLVRVVLLCGLLHLDTVAEKFQAGHWVTHKINVCELQWYIERFGTLTVVESNGQRWCECRPNRKTKPKSWGA